MRAWRPAPNAIVGAAVALYLALCWGYYFGPHFAEPLRKLQFFATYVGGPLVVLAALEWAGRIRWREQEDAYAALGLRLVVRPAWAWHGRAPRRFSGAWNGRGVVAEQTARKSREPEVTLHLDVATRARRFRVQPMSDEAAPPRGAHGGADAGLGARAFPSDKAFNASKRIHADHVDLAAACLDPTTRGWMLRKARDASLRLEGQTLRLDYPGRLPDAGTLAADLDALARVADTLERMAPAHGIAPVAGA